MKNSDVLAKGIVFGLFAFATCISNLPSCDCGSDYEPPATVSADTVEPKTDECPGGQRPFADGSDAVQPCRSYCRQRAEREGKTQNWVDGCYVECRCVPYDAELRAKAVPFTAPTEQAEEPAPKTKKKRRKKVKKRKKKTSGSSWSVPKTCCKHCHKGKPCGNSCIARNRTCRKSGGCAC